MSHKRTRIELTSDDERSETALVVMPPKTYKKTAVARGVYRKKKVYRVKIYIYKHIYIYIYL